ncbi:MAG: hypothetical protein HKN13_13875 [Rhodothermales bacterium]|nr:hypothetical protein [Rhodothermales bacterium]
MEKEYREGKHFRGDDYWTVKAKHKVTGETMEFEAWGDTAAEVRVPVREMLDDEVSPYQWELRPSKAVPGLGRSWIWDSMGLIQIGG